MPRVQASLPIHSPTRIPGPRPVPLLGVLGNLVRFLRNPVAYMRHLYETYGEIVTLSQGTTDYVFAFGPQYNQQVLGNPEMFYALDAHSSPIRMPANSALARLFAGLTHMNGDKHKQHRRLMTPAFHKKRIEAYRDDIVTLTEQKLTGWRVDQQRDVLREMRELTLAIAVKILIGLDPAQEGETLGALIEHWMRLVFSIPAMVLPLPIPMLPYYRLLKLSEGLDAAIRMMIGRKRASGVDQGDVLSMLLQIHDDDGDQLTDEELLGQTNFLFVAGHATTASVLTWTLFLLSQHPHVMADLLDELEGTLHGSAPTLEQLGALSLLDGVLKESMRLLPPVTWWSRISIASCKLGAYIVPQGTTVIISHYITHRLVDLYHEPNRFVPERWRTIHPGPYEYLPFSAGPRVCLGAALAMLEMKLVLSILVQRYRLSLRAGTRIDHGGLMLSAPKRGLPMVVGPQDRRFQKNEVCGDIQTIVDLG